jgi:5'-phosphate synthase pdxT subunit
VFTVGVVAFQGDVSEHLLAMRQACSQAEVVPIRREGIIPKCRGIVLPGGESTTIGRLLESTKVGDEIKEAAACGIPVMATCAGLVLVSRDIDGDTRVKPLGLMDVSISRNAFGPQRESFEADLEVDGFERPYRAVFIRAPAISRIGAGVNPLAKVDQHVVAASEKNILGLAFHPEITGDLRFHQIFLRMMEV